MVNMVCFANQRRISPPMVMVPQFMTLLVIEQASVPKSRGLFMPPLINPFSFRVVQKQVVHKFMSLIPRLIPAPVDDPLRLPPEAPVVMSPELTTP